MRAAFVVFGFAAVLLAVDEFAYSGQYREAVGQAIKKEVAEIEYEIRYFIRRASR